MYSHHLRTVAAALFLGSAALAGPLNPPAGPIAQTGRFGPRIEVNAQNIPGNILSTFRITEPGSYYLGKNVTGVPAEISNFIEAPNVTLDLGGFHLQGIPGAQYGVYATMPNVTVRNGSIDGYDLSGVRMEERGCVVEDVRVSSCQEWGINCVFPQARITRCIAIACGNAAGLPGGIQANGFGSIVESCIVYASAYTGIHVDRGCVVRGCSASICTFTGIRTASWCTVLGCNAWQNDGTGISALSNATVVSCASTINQTGIFSSGDPSFEDCIANDNTGRGLDPGRNSVVRGCIATVNDFDGICAGENTLLLASAGRSNGEEGLQVRSGCVVIDCLSAFNARGGIHGDGVNDESQCVIGSTIRDNGEEGVILGDRATVQRCTVVRNAEHGIRTGIASRVDSCSSTANGLAGIFAGTGSAVTNCLAAGNAEHGISAGSDCRVTGRTCDGNGTAITDGAGILLRGADGLADGNMVTDNDLGIATSSGGSLVTRNEAAGNTTAFDFSLGDAFGTTVFVAGVGAIDQVAGSEHPWANFIY